MQSYVISKDLEENQHYCYANRTCFLIYVFFITPFLYFLSRYIESNAASAVIEAT